MLVTANSWLLSHWFIPFSTDPLHPLVSRGRGELLLAEDDGLITKVTSAVGSDGELSQVSSKQVGHSHLKAQKHSAVNSEGRRRCRSTATHNPFTAPASKICRLKYAPMRLPTVSYVTSTFNAMHLDNKSFHVPVQKGKQKGLCVSNSALLLSCSSNILAVKGLMNRPNWSVSGLLDVEP